MVLSLSPGFLWQSLLRFRFDERYCNAKKNFAAAASDSVGAFRDGSSPQAARYGIPTSALSDGKINRV